MTIVLATTTNSAKTSLVTLATLLGPCNCIYTPPFVGARSPDARRYLDSIFTNHHKLLQVADETRPLLFRGSAKWPEVCSCVRKRDHRVRTRLVLAIEGSWLGRVKATGGGVFRVVEPEAYVECVGRKQSDRWIEPEDLIEQNRLDGDVNVTVAVGLQIRLVPGKAEVCEIRIELAVRQQVGVLDREQVESQVGFQVLGTQNEHVVVNATLHDYLCGGRVAGLGKAGKNFLLRGEVKDGLLDLRGGANDQGHH